LIFSQFAMMDWIAAAFPATIEFTIIW